MLIAAVRALLARVCVSGNKATSVMVLAVVAASAAVASVAVRRGGRHGGRTAYIWWALEARANCRNSELTLSRIATRRAAAARLSTLRAALVAEVRAGVCSSCCAAE